MDETTKHPTFSIGIDKCVYPIALLFFLKAIVLAFWITPLWDIPDEFAHFAYARDIALGKGIPLLGEAKIDADILIPAGIPRP